RLHRAGGDCNASNYRSREVQTKIAPRGWCLRKQLQLSQKEEKRKQQLVTRSMGNAHAAWVAKILRCQKWNKQRKQL
ncbi:MAG: hypothetical protein J6V20_03605, partial [Bacteroidaceae bacterium]|nr:hypothetical protein [Bacteroidaceae bacterium]